jgi:type II secretory ATPase GspE/PulE/Tfp pilus assembly ATPase PilB-like protein
MPLSDKIRRLVTSGAGSPDLFKAAREEGMRTLREAAIEKVFRGITTTTEMVRVTGS